MPRGVPLTPDELERAAEVYAKTGSYSKAARAIGAPDHSTVRKALLRLGGPDRSQLYARAIARSLRKSRRYLDRGQALAARLLAAEGTDGPGMEPQHIAALLNAISRTTETLATLQTTADKRRVSRLTRDKTRLETELLRAEVEQAKLDPSTGAPLLDPEDVKALVLQHFGGT
jgi:hypothetical protein